MTTTLNTRSPGQNMFDLRCARCGGPVELDSPGTNIGDLRYHVACAPVCATCGRTLHTGAIGWEMQGDVVSTSFGYTVRPKSVWCPDCLEAVPHREPAALD